MIPPAARGMFSGLNGFMPYKGKQRGHAAVCKGVHPDAEPGDAVGAQNADDGPHEY